MTNLIAKPIVKNKFWIVESKGEKIATIQANVDGSVNLVTGTIKKLFPTLKTLGKEYDIKFTRWAQPKELSISTHRAFDFPTATVPHNVLWNTKLKSAVYTESEKSKSYYCAGYYLIKDGKRSVLEFCPKLIVVERYEHVGPFKTKQEAIDAKS